MIRAYKTQDTDALITIWRAANALAHPFLPQDFVEQEAINLRDIYFPNAESWVIEHDRKPVGFIAMIGDEIGGLFVQPDCHGRGFGKALVDQMRAAKGPLCVEVFEANAIGRRFYDRYGFIEDSRYRHDGSGQMTIKMSLPSG